MSKYDNIGNSGLPWEGYYFTGYGLAVKRGFEGTEEQWLASLKGDKGDTGAAIVSQTKTGEDESGGYIYTQTFDDGSTKTFTAPKGAKGDTGEDGEDGEDGVGVPSGGTTGQVLKKKSGTNYDTAWASLADLETDPVFAASAAYGISASDISNWNGKYSLPGDGIPKDVMTASVAGSLDKADSAYQLPATGVPKTDLASSVQVSLDKADSSLQESTIAAYRTSAAQDVIDAAKYEKPASGIPETDLSLPVKTKLNRSDAYFATYGETDGFYILEALTAQKAVFVIVPNQDTSASILPLTYRSELPSMGQFQAIFTKINSNTMTQVQMNYDVTQSPTTSWSTMTILLEVNSNRVTSLSPSSTNTQYPSAKCVYDLVGNVETLLAALR